MWRAWPVKAHEVSDDEGWLDIISRFFHTTEEPRVEKSRHIPLQSRQKYILGPLGGLGVEGRRTYSFVTSLDCLTIDEAPLSRRRRSEGGGDATIRGCLPP